jgi:hypothetical protein
MPVGIGGRLTPTAVAICSRALLSIASSQNRYLRSRRWNLPDVGMADYRITRQRKAISACEKWWPLVAPHCVLNKSDCSPGVLGNARIGGRGAKHSLEKLGRVEATGGCVCSDRYQLVMVSEKS